MSGIKKRRQRWRLRLLREYSECIYCAKTLNEQTATLEHLIPLSKGGPDSYSNCALACYRCNTSRAALEYGAFGDAS